MTDNFVVVCPFASRFAFQIWIVPRDIDSTYETSSPEVQFELGQLTRECIARIELLLDKPAYNVLLHDSPHRSAEPNQDRFRPWYFEIFPRLTRAAGYELGTDIWVNPVAPVGCQTTPKLIFANGVIREAINDYRIDPQTLPISESVASLPVELRLSTHPIGNGFVSSSFEVREIG